MTRLPAPRLHRVRTLADLDHIPFSDGQAALEVPAAMLPELPVVGDARGESDRLWSLERSIRSKGYQPVEPIVARVGPNGEWIILNGGHRLTAARHVMTEFWANLFQSKVGTLYFVLFTDSDSWRDTGVPSSVSPLDLVGSFQAAQDAWERSEKRNHVASPGLVGRR